MEDSTKERCVSTFFILIRFKEIFPTSANSARSATILKKDVYLRDLANFSEGRM